MDDTFHSIGRLLFVPLKRHTAFNGQISIGVGHRFCVREFAPSGDKPPPAGAAYPIGLLNAHTQNKELGGLHLRFVFLKKQIGGN